MRKNPLLAELARIVGAHNVLDKPEARAKYANDQWWYAIAAAAAQKPVSRPDAAVRPTRVEQVAAIVKLANKHRIPITPWGGGSGVQGAANATCGGIVLDLRGMNRVRSLDKQSLTGTVEAGKICREFEAELNQQGLSFTHYPASTEWATIGGCIAARGSGVLSTKYGKIEEHVLSIEFVTPTGEIVHTPSVPRHAAGPEITQLLVGAEGTLGIVTAAVVKLHPLPQHRVFGAFHFQNLSDGIEAGRRIMVSGLKPPALRLYDREATEHSLSRATEMKLTDATMVMIFDGEYPDLVELEASKAFELCRACDGDELPAGPSGKNIGEIWWEKRYVYYYPPFAPQLPSIWGTVDVVADFAHIEAVYHATTKAIRAAVPARWNLSLLTHFSHWYEWGSMIYARAKIPAGPKNLAEAKKLHDAIFREGTLAALQAGAVMNDHHGVGLRLAPYMKHQFGDGLKYLQRIKRAVDPKNLLCPGKLGL